MVRDVLIVAIDLGTNSTTACHIRARDSFDIQGNLHRRKLGSVSDVKDWPACIGGATGNNCVPTDLVYNISTRKLLFWGFQAQKYLDDQFNPIPRSDTFLVEAIKLLLLDPDEAKIPSVASERYRRLRKSLMVTLKKRPDEVFEDLLDSIMAHVFENAIKKYRVDLHNHQIELVLAFPSGWDEHIHTMVSRIGARAVQKAVTIHGLKNMGFGIENVYTVSETLCGVKEWLRETVAEDPFDDFEPQMTNLDGLNEGDCFIGADIGGGTGCLTPLKLVSRNPLGVEQLGRTQSLEASGEAVQAEFERMLRARITAGDCTGDLELAIYQICRKFKEEKKNCGASLGSDSKTWNCPVIGLKANPRKGYERNCMRFDRRHLDRSFDPPIDEIDRGIEEMRRKHPGIKAIIFMGQFGGSSAYLQKRMASNSMSRVVKIWHSESGKLDVVKGAIYERLALEETFVRRFKTVKAYGTLVALKYCEEVAKVFPKPQTHGAVPFERAEDGLRLKVIEWALPKGTIIHNGRVSNIGVGGLRHHTWAFSEDDLGFEDIIIVSEEDVPMPQLWGKSYTLWTKAHEENKLYIAGQRRRVAKSPFIWDLIMSQKLDALGNIIGPYGRDDLSSGFFPEKKEKKRRRKRCRILLYDLIWEITEMQVKVYVQAFFPNQVGSPLLQLAKEQTLDPEEKIVTGESRSKALEKDIEIANNLSEENDEDGNGENSNGEDGYDEDGNDEDGNGEDNSGRDGSDEDDNGEDGDDENGNDEDGDDEDGNDEDDNDEDDNGEDSNDEDDNGEDSNEQNPSEEDSRNNTNKQFNKQLMQHQQPEVETLSLKPRGEQEISRTGDFRVTVEQEQDQMLAHGRALRDFQEHIQPVPLANLESIGLSNPSVTSQKLWQDKTQHSAGGSTSNSSRIDGRRRDGCQTCKYRKKKCDCIYIIDAINGTRACKTCLHFGIRCDITEPDWVHDAAQREVQQRQRKEIIKQRKRKSRDSLDSQQTVSQDWPTAVVLAESEQQSTDAHLAKRHMKDASPQRIEQPRPIQRLLYAAIGGGKGSSRHAKN